MKKSDLLFWLAVVGTIALLGTGGVIVYNQTRGLRNNNPGNIRRTSDIWLGMSPSQSDDAFVQFSDPKYGIRAMARILMNYASRGMTTLRDVANAWAPNSENDSDAYARSLAESVGVGPDQPIDISNNLPSIIPAIIRQENGLQPYADSTIASGIALA